MLSHSRDFLSLDSHLSLLMFSRSFLSRVRLKWRPRRVVSGRPLPAVRRIILSAAMPRNLKITFRLLSDYFADGGSSRTRVEPRVQMAVLSGGTRRW
jgi:hypothetical protein